MTQNDQHQHRDKQLLALALGLSLVPDLDFVPGVIADNIGEFHNGATHSPVMALVVAIIVATVFRPRRRHGWRDAFLFVLTAYGLHVVADFVTWGRGSMLFWPFSLERIRPPLYLFYGLRRSAGLVSSQHFITLANELVFVAALLISLRMAENVQKLRRARAADREAV